MDDAVQVNQGTNIFGSEIEAGKRIPIEQYSTRQIYLACLEGSLRINDVNLQNGDAAKIQGEAALNFMAIEDCLSIIVEIPRSD